MQHCVTSVSFNSYATVCNLSELQQLCSIVLPQWASTVMQHCVTQWVSTVVSQSGRQNTDFFFLSLSKNEKCKRTHIYKEKKKVWSRVDYWSCQMRSHTTPKNAQENPLNWRTDLFSLLFCLPLIFLNNLPSRHRKCICNYDFIYR